MRMTWGCLVGLLLALLIVACADTRVTFPPRDAGFQDGGLEEWGGEFVGEWVDFEFSFVPDGGCEDGCDGPDGEAPVD